MKLIPAFLRLKWLNDFRTTYVEGQAKGIHPQRLTFLAVFPEANAQHFWRIYRPPTRL